MNFNKIKEITYHSTRIRWYKSSVTGLQFVLISVPGPICYLDAVVRTEMESDAYDTPHYGLPHTLEHLVFMGSDSYPYKGILDQIANRCFSHGTNAYTSIDETVYTVSCGGSEGFLRLLPVYMDHILNATISDEAFITEVHHINDEGEDAGVVYCEMQGCENTAGNVAYHKHIETLYENTSYASNTGGHVAQLRRLTVDKVRSFHNKYYRPDNCCAILTGDISEKDAFQSMNIVEENLIKHSKTCETLPSFQKPFSNPIPPIIESKTSVVEFPANDEEGGAYVYLGWRLEKWEDFLTHDAIYTLWNYLCESSISPVKKEFIETENPLAGSAEGHIMPYREASHCLLFSDVTPENSDTIAPKFFELVNRILEEGIDMERMAQVLKKRKISELAYMEESPHSYFTDSIQSFFLYSDSMDLLENRIDEIKRFSELEKKDKSYWEELMKKYIINRPVVITICKPSVTKGEEIAKEEEQRLEKQKDEFGEEQIKKFGDILKNAEKVNSTPIPIEILNNFPIPKVDKIPQLPVAAANLFDNSTYVIANENEIKKQLEEKILRNGDNIPVKIQFNHFESAFINVHCFMDTSELPDYLRQYVELYLEAVFDCPILRDDVLIPHEEVVKQFNNIVVSHSNACGMSGGNFVAGDFSQLLKMDLKFEKENYELMIKWLSEFLFKTVFTVERLKISASKLIVDTARVKRSPTSMGSSVVNILSFDKNRSNRNVTNVYKQTEFLENILKRLENDPETVVSEMNQFRDHITDANRLRIHVFGNIFSQKDVVNPWKSIFLVDGKEKVTQLQKLTFDRELLLDSVLKDGNKTSVALGLRSTDSGFLTQIAPGITNFNDPDRSTLLVVIELLSCLEGPLWTNIRGKGLAYGYNIRNAVSNGLVYFSLHRSGNLPSAYEESYKIVNEYKDGIRVITKESLEAAKAGVIYQLLKRQSSTEIAAICSFLFTLQNSPQNMNATQLKQCEGVDSEQAIEILKKYIVPLFDSEKSISVIISNPSKLESLCKDFSSFRNYEIKAFEEIML